MTTFSNKKRTAVYAKTEGVCAYCGDAIDFESFVIDHVLPKHLGGKHGLDNLMPCCNPCNASKGKKTLDQFRRFCAVKTVTQVTIFGQEQVDYLFERGAFPLLGFNPEYKFHFERAGGEA